MRVHPFFKSSVIIIFSAIVICGCGLTANQAKKEEEIKRINLRKENYQKLQNWIASKKIKKGMTKTEVKTEFGEPDDIFRSGSSVSSMEIWAYEKILEQEDIKAFEMIRLYFNSDQLTTWQF